MQIYGADAGSEIKTYIKKTNGGTYKQQPNAIDVLNTGVYGAGYDDLSAKTTYTVKAEIYKDGKKQKTLEKEQKTKSSASATMASVIPVPAEMELVPLFTSIGVYVPAEEGTECVLKYRQKVFSPGTCAKYFYHSIDRWIEGFEMTYQNGQFIGSIFNLKENNEYEVSAVVTKDGEVVNQYTAFVKTLSSNVEIAETIDLSSIYSGSGALMLAGVEGSEDGWIEITDENGIGVNADNTTYTNAVTIADCKYLILNGITIKGGKKNGISIMGESDNVRISRCDISKWGRNGTFAANAGKYAYGYVDSDGNRINNDAAINIRNTTNTVIEYNYIHDSNTKTNAWTGTAALNGSTVEWSNVHPGGPSGIFLRSKSGLVIRYNDIIGSEEHRFNDAVESKGNGDYNGGVGKDAEIYGNVFAYCQDDGIELDGGAVNVRFFNNRIEETHSGISIAPIKIGPTYIYGNVVHNLRDEFGQNSSIIKAGGGTTHSTGMAYAINNTFVANKNFSSTRVSFGIHAVGYGDDDNREMYQMKTRNNVFFSSQGSRTAIDEDYAYEENSFDYDLAGTNAATDSGRFQLLSPNEKEEHGIIGIAAFKDMNSSKYNLTDGGLGTSGAADVAGFNYTYMGAIDKYDTGLIPKRPASLSADKYTLTISAGQSGEIVLTNNTAFDVNYSMRKSCDFSKVTVNNASGTIKGHGSVTIKVTASSDVDSRYDGMLMFVQDNGYSIPVNVKING